MGIWAIPNFRMNPPYHFVYVRPLSNVIANVLSSSWISHQPHVPRRWPSGFCGITPWIGTPTRTLWSVSIGTVRTRTAEKTIKNPCSNACHQKKHDHVLPSLLHSDQLRILQTLVGLSRRQRLLCHGLRNLTRTSDRNLVQFGNDKLGNRTENPGFNGNHACHAHGDFIVKLDFGRVSYFCWDSDQDSNQQQRASTHAAFL